MIDCAARLAARLMLAHGDVVWLGHGEIGVRFRFGRVLPRHRPHQELRLGARDGLLPEEGGGQLGPVRNRLLLALEVLLLRLKRARAVPEERQCGLREHLLRPTGEVVLRLAGHAAHVELEVLGRLWMFGMECFASGLVGFVRLLIPTVAAGRANQFARVSQ